MQSLQQAFEQTAVQGMQNLTQQFNQGANPQAGAPDLKDINQKSDRLAKDLEGIKDRMDALDTPARRCATTWPRRSRTSSGEMLNENGKLSERDLQELRDFLARMREQMKDLQTQEENLLNAAENGGDMKDLEQKQADLDKQMENLLAAARKLLDAKRNPAAAGRTSPTSRTRRTTRRRSPPKDEDSQRAAAQRQEAGRQGQPRRQEAGRRQGRRRQGPARHAGAGRPATGSRPALRQEAPAGGEEAGDKDDRTPSATTWKSQQNDRLRDLDTAQKSLAADQQTLEQMLHGLEQA